MQRRYRYRCYPDLSQQAALARAFGCARVVFNDGLRLRQDAYAAGLPYIKDVDVQRAVITQAKRTPVRAWLTEVSSVVLVQSVNDLHRAYRNYFNDLARVKAARARGEKAKLRVRQPKFKAKHDDQAIRLTRNGFALRPNGRLFVAKVGEVQVRWSRPLPAGPSSVTITLDGAGRYHASFVVEVPAEPLSSVETAVGGTSGWPASRRCRPGSRSTTHAGCAPGRRRFGGRSARCRASARARRTGPRLAARSPGSTSKWLTPVGTSTMSCRPGSSVKTKQCAWRR